jgi:DNA-binding transcriptional MerR regulator
MAMNDHQEKATLTSGSFGRMCQLSRKALRLYDRRGLLVPAYVDPESGYRYYTHDQVALGRRIRLLRSMEMSLEEVQAVLAAWDTAEARQLIDNHCRRYERRLAAVQLLARLVLDEFSPEKEHAMSFEVTFAEMPAQTVVSIRRHIRIPAYHQWIQPALTQLWAHIRSAGAQPVGDPLALYYGPVNEEDDGPVEICVPFRGQVPPKGEIKVRELPAHKAVQMLAAGEYQDYPQLLEVWNAVGRYVHEQGLASNWDGDMTTYEIWYEDRSMMICWPVRTFEPAADQALSGRE